MTRAAATGYDGLSSRQPPESELRAFLRDCFALGDEELFVGHADRVTEALAAIPADARFAAFCTYREVSGHFAMAFDVGIEGRLAERVGRREFAVRLAACFATYVLYGDTEPPGLWSLIRPDGSHLLAALHEDDDRYLLDVVTAPLPDKPGVRVDESLWQVH
ncbi:hypothetical protein GCM10027280_02390 [Micromonospora polyrhachis]|uniref:Uncharacterized protein n=1 Tax=Micromonospora polyrhachis TaxID=1282883 RepID=A0A7W7SPR6_9ACTN|nr:hypothetical protein [Micromonospora polyrhachis]MBB4957465.1 hypothetical protein [Micromonospora polyrhachis]